jgi:Gpi18-like mannosyltransferase
MIADFGYSGAPIFFGIALLFSPALVIFTILLLIFKNKLRDLGFWRKIIFIAGLFFLGLIIWAVLLAGIFHEEIQIILS